MYLTCVSSKLSKFIYMGASLRSLTLHLSLKAEDQAPIQRLGFVTLNLPWTYIWKISVLHSSSLKSQKHDKDYHKRLVNVRNVSREFW